LNIGLIGVCKQGFKDLSRQGTLKCNEALVLEFSQMDGGLVCTTPRREFLVEKSFVLGSTTGIGHDIEFLWFKTSDDCVIANAARGVEKSRKGGSVGRKILHI